MAQQKTVIELKDGRNAVLVIEEFDSEMSIDDILRIDYNNIMGEILTFPLMFNRIANLKADVENILAETRLDLDVFEAQLTETKRKFLLANGSKGTLSEVEALVKQDPGYSAKKKHYFKVQKEVAYLDGLYWAAQSKDTKLNKITEKIRPEEFEKELLEDTINGVMIKITKRFI